jgi:hypothetical protein
MHITKDEATDMFMRFWEFCFRDEPHLVTQADKDHAREEVTKFLDADEVFKEQPNV